MTLSHRQHRGPTGQRKAAQKPDAEIHIQKRLVKHLLEQGFVVAEEVDRGNRIVDVMALDRQNNINVFEVKVRDWRSALKQLRRTSADWKFVVMREKKLRDSSLKQIRAEGVGLLFDHGGGAFTVIESADFTGLTNVARRTAIAAIKRNQVKEEE